MFFKNVVAIAVLTIATTALPVHADSDESKSIIQTASTTSSSVLEGVKLEPLTTAEEGDTRGKGFFAVFNNVWKAVTWLQCRQFALACKAY